MRRLACVVLSIVPALAACGVLDPRPDPTRFYVLTSDAERAGGDTAAAAAAASPIGIGPITLPSYLERPELVRRSSDHEVAPSRVERWAEPLDRATSRVLAADLAQLTGRPVAQYPWRTSLVPVCAVAIDVARFEAVDGGRVELVADLACDRASDKTPVRRRERIEMKLDGPDGAAVARAMSDALRELAKRIAEMVGTGDRGR
jgi:uncharacterized lipoprotein YmbA